MSGISFPTYIEEHEQNQRQTSQQPVAPPPQQNQQYVDPIQLHPLLNMPIPKGVEYMSVDDPQASSGWGDSLMYHFSTYFVFTIMIYLYNNLH